MPRDSACEEVLNVYHDGAVWLETLQLREERLQSLDLIGRTQAPEGREGSFPSRARARSIARGLERGTQVALGRGQHLGGSLRRRQVRRLSQQLHRDSEVAARAGDARTYAPYLGQTAAELDALIGLLRGVQLRFSQGAIAHRQMDLGAPREHEAHQAVVVDFPSEPGGLLGGLERAPEVAQLPAADADVVMGFRQAARQPRALIRR